MFHPGGRRLPASLRAPWWLVAVVFVALAGLAGLASGDTSPDGAVAAGRETTGGMRIYVTKRGDSLSLVGARFGESPSLIARDSDLPRNVRLRSGQPLWIAARHIVPGGTTDGIVVNIPQKMLFLFRGGLLEASYPVAVGQATWQTPTGDFTIGSRDRDPTWVVPVEIQAEMREKDWPVLTRVLPGPDNPLGAYRLRLANTDYALHGTNAPASIYTYGTHGCIRLGPDDIAALFAAVTVGEPVRLVYAPILLAEGDDGKVFLEAHPDIYNRGT